MKGCQVIFKMRIPAYQAVGKLYVSWPELLEKIILQLVKLQSHKDFLVRQTVISFNSKTG